MLCYLGIELITLMFHLFKLALALVIKCFFINFVQILSVFQIIIHVHALRNSELYPVTSRHIMIEKFCCLNK